MSFKIFGYEQTNHVVEAQVYDAFIKHSDSLEKLFSFGVANWTRYGDEMESDLILVGRTGLYVVEVKGGRIDIRDGIYHQNGRQMKTSPLKQASTNFWKIMHLLHESKLSKFKHVGGGYVCLFPETTWDYTADVSNSNIILDYAFDQSLVQNLSKIATWYRKQNSEQGLFSGQLSADTIAKIKSILVGSTKRVSDIRQTININAHKYIELSEEQHERYQEISENKHIIIKGPPGSGKTLLAYQIMKDSEKKGIKTLFLCKNKALATHLRQKIVNELGCQPEHLEIINIDQLASQHADDDLPPSDFGAIVSSATANLLNNSDFMKFEYLLIDEGQDLMRDEYIDLMEVLVTGGIEKGRWCIFVDFDQNLLNVTRGDNESTDAEELFDVYFAANATIKRLTKNYRNTDIIQRTATVLSQTQPVGTNGLRGESPEFKVFNNQEEEARIISNDINALITDGVKPSEITVISFVGKDRSVAGQGLIRLKNGIQMKHINELDLSIMSAVDATVTYASIYEYKGLDNDVILFTDIKDIDNHKISSSLHLVGATRARNHFKMYVTPEVMKRLLDPTNGNLLHSIDPEYTN